MWIQIPPNLYKQFYLKLLDKFIEVELKNDITGYPKKSSRQIWTHWDREHDTERSKYLFSPRHRRSFSHEYFWIRFHWSLRSVKDLPIYAESFTKAFHYIGFDYLKNSQEYNVVKKAELQLKHMEMKFIKKLGTKGLDSSYDISDNLEPLIDTINNYQPLEYQKDKIKGTYFVEHELPEILSDTMPDNYGHPAILFIDIDDLTVINKKFGTDVGDIILEEIEDIIVRLNDFRFAGRCGDDTFYGVLLATTPAETHYKSQKLKAEVQNHNWSALAAQLRVTVTIGTAILKLDESIYSWLERSARGMLRGKELGGNNVMAGPKFLQKKQAATKTIEKTTQKKKAVQKGKTKEQRRIDRQNNKGGRPIFTLRDFFS